MKRPALLISGLILAFAVHAQVYQYKDASGRTVFSDQPPPGATPKRTVSNEPSSAPAGAPEQKNLADQELEFRKRQKERQEAAAKADKEAADKAARKEDCERAKRTLAGLESGQRLATTDDKGERNFLDDGQREAEIQRMRKILAERCK